MLSSSTQVSGSWSLGARQGGLKGKCSASVPVCQLSLSWLPLCVTQNVNGFVTSGLLLCVFSFSFWQIAEQLLYEHWKKNDPKLREVKIKIFPMICLNRWNPVSQPVLNLYLMLGWDRRGHSNYLKRAPCRRSGLIWLFNCCLLNILLPCPIVGMWRLDVVPTLRELLVQWGKQWAAC